MRRIPFAVALVLSIVPAIAHAQDSAAAEALFREGRQLLEQKNYAAACPKLAESYRQDPATGTLLALAICQESSGKLASAWASYLDVASRAKQEGRSDREEAARKKAVALEPQLSHVTITVAPEIAAIAGLVVKRDGVVVGAGAFATPSPVDGGDHVVEASAPGKNTWKQGFSIAKSGESKTVAVGKLDDASAAPISAAPVTPPEAPPAPSPPPEPAPAGNSTLRLAGLVVGGLGVVGLGIGTGFGFSAKSKNDTSKSDCDGDYCDPQGNKSA